MRFCGEHLLIGLYAVRFAGAMKAWEGPLGRPTFYYKPGVGMVPWEPTPYTPPTLPDNVPSGNIEQTVDHAVTAPEVDMSQSVNDQETVPSISDPDTFESVGRSQTMTEQAVLGNSRTFGAMAEASDSVKADTELPLSASPIELSYDDIRDSLVKALRRFLSMLSWSSDESFTCR